MNTSMVGGILHEALIVAVKLAGPALISCMLIGILVAIFQAVTSIHEQSLGFILKLIAVVTFLLAGGGWMLQTLQDFVFYVFDIIAQ